MTTWNAHEVKDHEYKAQADKLTKGDLIWVSWGRFGQRKAKVTNISRGGLVYASRWNVKRKAWTKPRRLYWSTAYGWTSG